MAVIIGIDPGLTRCGIGIVSVDKSRKCRLVQVQTATSAKDLDAAARIHSIAAEIESAIAEHSPEAIALERVFAQANLRTVMGTAQISGVVMYLAAKYGIPVCLYTPTQVKAAVTGSGRADKLQVGTMITKILGLESIPKPADAADALAIAITHAWQGNSLNSGENLTPAQKAWASAEVASKRKR